MGKKKSLGNIDKSLSIKRNLCPVWVARQGKSPLAIGAVQLGTDRVNGAFDFILILGSGVNVGNR